MSAENAAVLPETLTNDLADGVYRADVQGNGLSVLKEGENFFVVEPTTRHISRALGLEELSNTLRGVRSEVAAEGRLAIGKTVENKPFVEIENDILDGVPESDWIKTVKSNLATKFPNGIKLGKNTVKINLTTRREMTFSKYMQWLKANDPQAFSDKLRATDNVDEILQATTGWINEGLNHPRSDSVTDFARGTVLIKVGQHDYSADVVVGSAQDGSMLMYDIINLQPTTITKKETSSVITGDPSREASRKALHLSDTSITENAEKSNSFAEKNSANDANSATAARRVDVLDASREQQTSGETAQEAEDNGKARREAIAIDVWARENIPDYAGLNAPARGAVRATVRNARAHGISNEEVLVYARVAARSGLNISFDAAQAAGGDARFDGRNTVYVNPNAPAARIQSKLMLHEGGHALFFKTKSGKKLLARAVEMADAKTAAEVREQYTKYYEKQNVDKSVYEPIIEEEIAAAGLESALGVDGAWEFILSKRPTAGEKLLSFFRGAARDYAGVGELSAEARKLLRTYQKAFAELAAYNQGNNALTGINGEKTQVSETKKAADDGGSRYSLSKNAPDELHKALYDTTYRSDVLLRDVSPAIMLAQKGVKNLPMAMKVAHIRENVFTENEAQKLGLPVNDRTHYHGLGEKFFLQIIDGLDNVREGYRGTKNASNPARRENYFLLVSEFKDTDGNVINVPVYIDEYADINRVFVDVNKISTAFGKTDFYQYVQREIKKGNLVRIKNRSTLISERDAPIAPDYEKDASDSSIHQNEPIVKQNEKNLLENRVSGDDLLNAQDLISDVRDLGAEVDERGYITLYHRTSASSAAAIRSAGMMLAKEDGLFFSTKENGQNVGYGDTVVTFKIPAEKLVLDDVFDDEAHLRYPLKKPGRVSVKEYLAEGMKPQSSSTFDGEGRLALPKDTKSRASAETEDAAREAKPQVARKSADTITMSKGRLAALQANYHGDKVFAKKKKGASQRGSGNSVPSHLNDSPFAISVPDSDSKSNTFPKKVLPNLRQNLPSWQMLNIFLP